MVEQVNCFLKPEIYFTSNFVEQNKLMAESALCLWHIAVSTILPKILTLSFNLSSTFVQNNFILIG